MIFASSDHIAQITVQDNEFCGVINAEVVRISGGKVPCYAIWGRTSVLWWSVASNAVVTHAAANKLLARVGVSINQVLLAS